MFKKCYSEHGTSKKINIKKISIEVLNLHINLHIKFQKNFVWNYKINILSKLIDIDIYY